MENISRAKRPINQNYKLKEKLTFTGAQMCISIIFLNPEDKLLELIIFLAAESKNQFIKINCISRYQPH